MENAILFAQYGGAGPNVEPHSICADGPKVLYVLDDNDGVESFAFRLKETYKTIGVEHPGLLRLYAM